MAASQPAATLGLEVVEFSSYIRGYHAYKEIWIPQVGRILLLMQEPTNPKDSSAVAVKKKDEVVGHIPYNVTSLLSTFLRRMQQGICRSDWKPCQSWSGILNGSFLRLYIIWTPWIYF